MEAVLLRRCRGGNLSDAVPAVQLAIWEGDLNQYVLEEGDESFEFSVRLNAQHVLQEISSNFGPAAAEAISTAAHARLEEAERLRAAAHPQWWKCREAGLLALGILAEDLQGFEEAQAIRARLILPYRCSFLQQVAHSRSLSAQHCWRRSGSSWTSCSSASSPNTRQSLRTLACTAAAWLPRPKRARLGAWMLLAWFCRRQAVG